MLICGKLLTIPIGTYAAEVVSNVSSSGGTPPWYHSPLVAVCTDAEIRLPLVYALLVSS